MTDDLMDHFNKSQTYLKLGDKDTFKGVYVSWEAINMSFKGQIKKGYRFVLEREDGSRLNWDTGNGNAITQIGVLIRQGMKRGDPITIHREGSEKENTRYTVTSRSAQPLSNASDEVVPF